MAASFTGQYAGIAALDNFGIPRRNDENLRVGSQGTSIALYAIVAGCSEA